MTSPERRLRILAGFTRSRLLAALRATGRPMGVRELADVVGLHPNTLREHLDLLVEAGVASRTAAPAHGRGRPALLYAAVPDRGDEDRPYQALARVLAEELARRPDAAAAATEAGEHWGRAIALPSVAPSSRPVSADEARERIVAFLDEEGFAPEASEPSGTARPDDPIRLRRCPFVSLAAEQRDVVCGIHLGLMRGALDVLGAPLEAVALEPFVAPDLCIAHLEARPHA